MSQKHAVKVSAIFFFCSSLSALSSPGQQESGCLSSASSSKVIFWHKPKANFSGLTLIIVKLHKTFPENKGSKSGDGGKYRKQVKIHPKFSISEALKSLAELFTQLSPEIYNRFKLIEKWGLPMECKMDFYKDKVPQVMMKFQWIQVLIKEHTFA